MESVYISMGDAVLYSVLGMVIVFFALFLLQCIIKLMWVFEKKDAPAAAVAAPTPVPAPAPAPAPGSAGELKLYDTDPRDAAMIMAIVADNMGVPLNELRFKSIREVK